MSEMTLFKGQTPAISDELRKAIEGTDDNLSGGFFGPSKRISFRGGRFRQIQNGEQVAVSESTSMNVVIVHAAPVSRTYYEGDWDSAKTVPPTCWSDDTKTPSPDVKTPVHSDCDSCPMNIKGSGQNENSRACRYNQRLAVCIENDYDNVYQAQVSATSIFGDSENNQMPLQAYAKFLKAHNAQAIAVVTELKFDVNVEHPKLFFSPVRPLDEGDLKKVLALRTHPDTLECIAQTVAVIDHVGEVPSLPDKQAAVAEETAPVTGDKPDDVEKPKPKRTRRTKAQIEADKAAEAAEAAVVELTPAEKALADAQAMLAAAQAQVEAAAAASTDAIDEPTKVEGKSEPVVTDTDNMSDLVAEWDD